MKRITFLVLIFAYTLFSSQKKSIDGVYRISCFNKYQILDIDKNNVYMSLYKNNIYINCKIVEYGNAYNLYFFSTEPPLNKQSRKIEVLNISKNIPIGRLKQYRNGLKLEWLGLYNTHTKKREFIKNAILVEDNENHSTTIYLKKCD